MTFTVYICHRWRVWRRSWKRWQKTTRICCVPSSTSSRRWNRRTRRRGAQRRPSRRVPCLSVANFTHCLLRPVCWHRPSMRPAHCGISAPPSNEKTRDYGYVLRLKVLIDSQSVALFTLMFMWMQSDTFYLWTNEYIVFFLQCTCAKESLERVYFSIA